jgi:hypothetical protein
LAKAEKRYYLDINCIITNFQSTFLKNTTPFTPGITEKKVPPRHQSRYRYIGSTLNVVYRKLKEVEAPITFAIGS